MDVMVPTAVKSLLAHSLSLSRSVRLIYESLALPLLPPEKKKSRIRDLLFFPLEKVDPICSYFARAIDVMTQN